MDNRTTFDESDQGKDVINAHGDKIGAVAEIEDGTAHVDPDPNLSDKIGAKLGWEDADMDTYTLSSDSVDEITDDKVRLREDL